jgi:hypothetical protein
VDFLWLWLWVLLPLLCDFGAGVAGSAAIEAEANPRVNNAAVIRVADLFIRSPSGGIDKLREEYAGCR